MNRKIIAIVGFLLFFNLLFFDHFFLSLNLGSLGFAVLVTGANLFLIISFFERDFPKKHAEGLAFSLLAILYAWIAAFRGDRGFLGFLLWLGSAGFTVLTLYNYASSEPALKSVEDLILLPFGMGISFLQSFLSNNVNLPKGTKINKYVPLLRGLIVAVPILAILLLLLTAADPIFSKIFQNTFSFMKDFPGLARRILVTILWLFFLLPLSMMVIKKYFRLDFKILPIKDLTVESLTVVGLTVLFLGWFLLVQFKYLFASVPETQLIRFGVNTYSEYVNRGFFELVFASLFVYSIISAGLFVYHQFGNEKKPYLRNLNLILAGELLLLLISVFRRVILYQHYHGLTIARVYGIVFLLWLAGMILALIGRHFWQKRWVMLEIIGTAIVLVGVGLFNVDNFVVTQSPPTVNGEVDETYLAQLSADGYGGWKRAYIWADKTMVGLINKQSPGVEDYRRLIYSTRISNNLLDHYRLLYWRYGFLGKFPKPAIGVEKNRFDWQDFNYGEWSTFKKMTQEISLERLEEMDKQYSVIVNRFSQEVIDKAFIDRGEGQFILR